MPKTLKLSEQAVKDAIEECPESKCLLESLFPEMKTDATVRLVYEAGSTRVFDVPSRQFTVVEQNGTYTIYWKEADGGWFRLHRPRAGAKSDGVVYPTSMGLDESPDEAIWYVKDYLRCRGELRE